MKDLDSDHHVKKDPRTAILLVTPGTTREGAAQVLEKCIAAFRSAYPDAVVRHAIVSELVRQVMAEDGIIERSPIGGLADLIDEGFSRMIVQPLYITPGKGLHELYSVVDTFNRFSGKHAHFGIDGILIGKPLLMDTEDYRRAADVIASYLGTPAPGEATVLVASADESGADTSLCKLQLIIDEKTGGQMVIGSCCDYLDINWVIRRLGHINARKVTLVPLALIPGKHADYDFDANQDSWAHKLKAAGYEVTVSDKILGESPAIASLFTSSVGETGKSHGFL
jgi:sirohydrochlorin cobaltochelatase